MNAHELKQLNVRIEKERTVLNLLIQEQQDIQSKINKSKQIIKDLETKIKKELNSSVVISEHAILRYLERVKGIDLEEIKQELLDEKTYNMIDFAKSCRVKKSGYDIIAKNNVIVTIET